jgi:hypothetical protein
MVKTPSRKGRPTVSFDGSVLTSNLFSVASDVVTENSEFLGSDWHHIGCSDDWGITRALANITKFYGQYVVEQCTVHWIPQVGPSSSLASSKVHFSYIDNAERMNKFQTATGSSQQAIKRSIALGCRNVFSFNAWERVSWNVPLTRRRKMFDVNTLDATTDIEEFERCVQGFIMCIYEATASGVSLGTFKIDFRVRFFGLDVGASGVV